MKKQNIIFNITVLLLSFLFFRFIWDNVDSDIQLHANASIKMLKDEIPFQVNFLYFYTIYFFSGFDINYLWMGSIIVLSLAVTLKFIISKSIINEIILKQNHTINPIMINILGCILLIVFTIPNPLLYIKQGYMYVGGFTPNMWHNSTTIFVMPFALLLFWTSYKQIQHYSNIRLLAISALIITNALIKPSYLFVFLLCYPIALIYKSGLSKKFWINSIPIVLAVTLIAIQYLFIYDERINHTSIQIKPLYILSYYSDSPSGFYTLFILGVSTLCGFLFPLISLIKNKTYKTDFLVQYSLIGLLIAIAISQLLVETGIRMTHGNLMWQVIICSYIVFLVFAAQLAIKFKNSGQKLKLLLPELTTISLHVIFGIVYILRIVLFQTYE